MPEDREEKEREEVHGHSVYYEEDAKGGLSHLKHCLASTGFEELCDYARNDSDKAKFYHRGEKYRLKVNAGGGYVLKRKDE